MPKGNNQAENTGREGRLGHFAVSRSGGLVAIPRAVGICLRNLLPREVLA